MKKVIVTLIAMLSMVMANAQENREAPYWFVGARGGISMPHESDYSKIFYKAPTATVSIGRMLTPEIGVRLNVNRDFLSASQKEILTPTSPVCFDKLTIDMDGMFNLSTLFGRKDYYPFNVYMLAGLGYNHIGGGFMAEYNFARNLSVSAETTLNSHQVWKAQIGINFKFGKKKEKIVEVVEEPVQEEPVAEEVKQPEPVPAPTPEPEPEPEPEVVVAEVTKLKETIFYPISKYDTQDEATINKVVEWCNNNKDKGIVVSGYADKGTGNAKVNGRVAGLRAKKVAAKIIAKGVNARRVTIKSYGDKVQPFAENDLNRATIIEEK